LQKEFQNIMLPTLWIKVGIDNLFDKPMPDVSLEELERWQTPNSIRWVNNSKDAQGNNIMALHVGSDGLKIVHGMNSSIAAYAKAGCNVIVDYIAYKPKWLDDLQNKLADLKTYYVAIRIPLATLEEREKARATSPVGHSRSHYDTVYGNIKYDFELDSGKYQSKELAQQLKRFIEGK
jgi:chloramphenicol 3-O-phosphotransferase